MWTGHVESCGWLIASFIFGGEGVVPVLEHVNRYYKFVLDWDMTPPPPAPCIATWESCKKILSKTNADHV